MKNQITIFLQTQIFCQIVYARLHIRPKTDDIYLIMIYLSGKAQTGEMMFNIICPNVQNHFLEIVVILL